MIHYPPMRAPGPSRCQEIIKPCPHLGIGIANKTIRRQPHTRLLRAITVTPNHESMRSIDRTRFYGYKLPRSAKWTRQPCHGANIPTPIHASSVFAHSLCQESGDTAAGTLYLTFGQSPSASLCNCAFTDHHWHAFTPAGAIER